MVFPLLAAPILGTGAGLATAGGVAAAGGAAGCRARGARGLARFPTRVAHGACGPCGACSGARGKVGAACTLKARQALGGHATAVPSGGAANQNNGVNLFGCQHGG